MLSNFLLPRSSLLILWLVRLLCPTLSHIDPSVRSGHIKFGQCGQYRFEGAGPIVFQGFACEDHPTIRKHDLTFFPVLDRDFLVPCLLRGFVIHLILVDVFFGLVAIIIFLRCEHLGNVDHEGKYWYYLIIKQITNIRCVSSMFTHAFACPGLAESELTRMFAFSTIGTVKGWHNRVVKN